MQAEVEMGVQIGRLNFELSGLVAYAGSDLDALQELEAVFGFGLTDLGL